MLKKVVLILVMFGIVLVIDRIDKRWNPLALPENQVYINELMKAVPILTTLSNDLFAPTLEELLFLVFSLISFLLKKRMRYGDENYCIRACFWVRVSAEN